MSQHTQTHTSHHVNRHDDFLVRFRKNLLIELSYIFGVIFFTLKMVIITVGAVFLFLKEFTFPLEVLSIVFPPLLVFLVGKYLTLLPMYIVVPLVFVPKKISLPIIGIAAFFSFFIVFLS